MPRHRLLLALLTASFFVVGLIEPHTAQPGDMHSPLSVIHIVAITALIYMWCKADSLARNAVPRKGAALFAAVFPPLGVPLYLFRSRPWKKGLRDVVLAVALLLLFALLQELGSAVSMRFWQTS